MRICVIGAGVAGLVAAFELVRRGCAVDIYERREGPGLGCSYYAGGMIAPWCERESAEPRVLALGLEGLTFWTEEFPVARRSGTLVVAPARDRAEVKRFSNRTSHFEECGEARIGVLEPALASRFPYGLYFAQEAHLEPRAALAALTRELRASSNVRLFFSTPAPDALDAYDWIMDCRGFEARADLLDLRGVKGEMFVLGTKDVVLSRPVRMLHPRHPVYLVPRPDGSFMVGATMVENEEPGRVTVRALLELLGAAYTIDPAFGEAEMLESGADVRPAFADHLPRLRLRGKRLYLNGLYRHGFLLSPAFARRAADVITQNAFFPEIMDEDSRQWRNA